MDPNKLFEDLTWADLTIDGDELQAVWEFDIKMLKHRDLQTVCGRPKIMGVKNALKEAILSCSNKKAAQFPVRLMGILLCDRFAWGFAHVGNVADWAELDNWKVANNQLFWVGVQEAFEGQDQAHDNMLFMDDEVLSDLHHINLRKVVPHSWREL